VRPTRAVVIDFAKSYLREPDESDEEWTACLYENDVILWMKKRLEQFLGIDMSLLVDRTNRGHILRVSGTRVIYPKSQHYIESCKRFLDEHIG
jgi:hypothetical protein